ncbi:MAG: hypothetical protein H6874_08855 [Hyphomicrobiaceae bacterium]|nr:hypothetical protein [Hyphomicrobiaceae bacterium]
MPRDYLVEFKTIEPGANATSINVNPLHVVVVHGEIGKFGQKHYNGTRIVTSINHGDKPVSYLVEGERANVVKKLNAAMSGLNRQDEP